jgi:hypothetical protein
VRRGFSYFLTANALLLQRNAFVSWGEETGFGSHDELFSNSLWACPTCAEKPTTRKALAVATKTGITNKGTCKGDLEMKRHSRLSLITPLVHCYISDWPHDRQGADWHWKHHRHR